MNAVIAGRGDRRHAVGIARRIARGDSGLPTARVALLGTGNVGQAVLARLAGWSGTRFGEVLTLAHVGNSRAALQDEGLCPAFAQACFASGTGVSDTNARTAGRGSVELHRLPRVLEGNGHRIVIDATASDEVAGHHAAWLAQGIHVVTACKLGQGASLARWRAIHEATAHGSAQYGDSATVGAGLPLLRAIRELQAGGDRIHAIAGVLSGSLAWLFNHYDGLRPLSGFVRQARDAGYTEPDPREDLSGEDVRRKILILARAAGVELEACEVEVESLVPEALAGVAREQVDAVLPALDAPLRARFAAARKRGEVLRFIARLDNADRGRGNARVGLESLPEDHPLAGGAGTDNKVAIWSDRYQQQPLVIQGPGAGADVTAAGLLDDALRIARSTRD
ncbi:MAG TPA: homoserine dehydrogenase [Lysobacter sp.]|nr:homoserine dehydrogenase [Lysobacter sp.]